MLAYVQMLESQDEKTKFEQLYLKYRNAMYYAADQILQNQQDAEDAVQQAFLSIIKNMDKIHGVDSAETYGYVVIIAERKAIDLIRQRGHFSAMDFESACFGVTMDVPGDGGVGDAIARLPAQYREVLLLRHAHGYSTKEISEILELSYEAARKLLYRAKIALKNQLDKEGAAL